MRAVRLAVVIAAILAGACSTEAPTVRDEAAVLPVESLNAYRLGPGDKFKITVFGQTEESGSFEVDNGGSLAYPLLGRVQVQGMTLPALQDYLTTALDKSFIINPRVTIEIQNYRPFFIYGEVQKPGSYPYVSGLTVRRAVAIAGGFSRRARFEPVSVIRESGDRPHKYTAALDVPVLPGDTIEVPRRLF